MSFKELVEALPLLIQLFVPGFVFVFIYNFFADKKTKHHEITFVGSVILSYIFKILCDLINILYDFSEPTDSMVTIVLAIICALIVIKISTCQKYKNVLTWIGRINGDDDIWHTIFDLNKGANVRFFSLYNHKKVEIRGIVKYYDVLSNGECQIVLSSYEIIYDDDTNYSSEEDTLLYVNSKDIHGLEIS